jgi:hypothetical protein
MSGRFIFNSFYKDDYPYWVCPNCHKTTLKIIPDSIVKGITPEAHKYHEREGYRNENDEFIFSLMLKCSQSNCIQPVAVIGVGGYEQQYIDRLSGEWDWFEFYRPKSFYPPIPAFTPCEQYPDKIKEQLQEISAHLPGHPQAAINALRTTLEIIMDYFEIPRDDKGRYVSLDKRIKEIPENYSSLREGFEALKWLGNTGSHNLKPVDEKDIDGACHMLDDFLQRIFRGEVSHTETIERLNRNHNPTLRKSKGGNNACDEMMT